MDRNRSAGGFAIYVGDNIPYVDCNFLLPGNVEAICIEIQKPKSKPLVLSTWYRPPDAKIELLNSFECLLKNIGTYNKEVLLTEDFNCNFLSPENSQYMIKLTDLLNDVTWSRWSRGKVLHNLAEFQQNRNGFFNKLLSVVLHNTFVV